MSNNEIKKTIDITAKSFMTFAIGVLFPLFSIIVYSNLEGFLF